MCQLIYSLIVSPTGPLNRCEDDVRRFSEAAEAGIKRALKCGAKAPLLMVYPDSSMEKSLLVSILGAFNALYTTLELRESEPSKAFKVESELKLKVITHFRRIRWVSGLLVILKPQLWKLQ